MNTMLANDFQALLFNYINNKLVGGTPLLDLWRYGGYVALIFCFLCDGTNAIFYSSFISNHGLKCCGNM